MEEQVKAEPKKEPKKESKVVMSPEQIASRKRAHEIKVARFLAGGEF